MVDNRNIGIGLIISILSVGLLVSTSLVFIQTEQIATLESELEDLTNDYENLTEFVTSLYSDYSILQEALEEPLEDPVIPNRYEVLNWLEDDDTNEHPFEVGIWMCGDYAAMLMTRAKTMNWRMRMAFIYWSYEGNDTYGSTEDPYGVIGHAVNLIWCTDGWWYIEPQTDVMFYVTNSTGDRTYFSLHEYYDFSGQLFGTIWYDSVIWTNFYGILG